MGNDIGSCLSFRAICFDFRSTNVGSSVIGTHSFWCHYPLITYLIENSVTQNNFKYKVNKVYFSYLFPVVVQSNVFSIVTDSWMKVVKSALSWFLTVRGESKTQKAENLKTQAQIFCLRFLCCRPRRAQLLDFPHHYWDVHDRVMGHPKTTTFHWGVGPPKIY